MLLGFLVALPSRRLVGDYLAIVTLFFGQLFVTVTNNGESMSLLGLTRDYNVTNGPNGIANIDPFHLFGHQLESLQSYFYVALAFFLVVLGVVYLVSNSRTGPRLALAARGPARGGADGDAREPAEAAGVRLRRRRRRPHRHALRLAATRPSSRATSTRRLLIIVYAILILGGAGSLGGVILGALIVNISLEVLRNAPNHATLDLLRR